MDAAFLCESKVGDGASVRFGTDLYLGGIMVGSGTTGVVLAHRNDSNLCEWLPYANALADKGYRVLAFDFAEEGSSYPRPSAGSITDDMVAAAQFIRTQGAGTLVLMGASKGGTAASEAASLLQPPPAGVVALSASGGFEGAHANVADLTVPALFIAGSGDGGFASVTRALAEGTPSGLGTSLIVDSPGHGTALLLQDQVLQAIDDFLTEHAPVTG